MEKEKIKDDLNTQESATGELNVSLGMAIMDAAPVLCFCITMILVGQVYGSVLFMLGAALCVLAGIGKVLWKILLAASKRDVSWLYRQFRYLMTGGGILMLLSLAVTRPNLSVLWENVSGFPCWILFLVAVVAFGIMGILAATLDAASGKANWIEQSVNLIAQLCLLMAVVIIWYGSDYYHADLADYEEEFLLTSIFLAEDENVILFDGPGTDTALIFYPGAKVEYTAYEPLMLRLAQSGIDCFLVEMPYNMAVFDVNAADELIGKGEYEHWYIGGHSLGGAMAASYASGNADKLEGVVLLAAYATKSLGDLTVLSIYGSEDGVLNLSKLEKGREYASNYTEICIEGGNHAWFGSYGEQDGDGEASITHEEQIRQTVEAIRNMIFADAAE